MRYTILPSLSTLWLRCNQSLLIQETQSAQDTDMTCSKMLLIKVTTCLQVGLMFLDWPVDPFARTDFSRSSLSPKVPSGEQQLGAFPASTHSRWRQDALQAQPQVLQRTEGWVDVVPSFPKACDVLHGTPGVLFDLLSSNKRTESSNSNISKDSLTPTTCYVSKRCMERTSISRLFRCWLRDFRFFRYFS